MTEKLIGTQPVFVNTSYFNCSLSPQTEATFGELQSFAFEFSEVTTILAFHSANLKTGGYVELLPKYGYCPMLIGTNQEPTPLYKFVEVLDGLVDYDEIRKELPNLSFAQIYGALTFLRKLTQFNTRDYDFDELEDKADAENQLFLSELRRGFADKETTRVLNKNELSR